MLIREERAVRHLARMVRGAVNEAQAFGGTIEPDSMTARAITFLEFEYDMILTASAPASFAEPGWVEGRDFKRSPFSPVSHGRRQSVKLPK